MVPDDEFSLEPYLNVFEDEFSILWLEVDTLPPQGVASEEKLFLQSFSF
jgi:hypothetical protein